MDGSPYKATQLAIRKAPRIALKYISLCDRLRESRLLAFSGSESELTQPVADNLRFRVEWLLALHRAGVTVLCDSVLLLRPTRTANNDDGRVFARQIGNLDFLVSMSIKTARSKKQMKMGRKYNENYDQIK